MITKLSKQELPDKPDLFTDFSSAPLVLLGPIKNFEFLSRSEKFRKSFKVNWYEFSKAHSLLHASELSS